MIVYYRDKKEKANQKKMLEKIDESSMGGDGSDGI
jgi:hypothetical protein